MRRKRRAFDGNDVIIDDTEGLWRKFYNKIFFQKEIE
jgi:hypothetical protein